MLLASFVEACEIAEATVMRAGMEAETRSQRQCLISKPIRSFHVQMHVTIRRVLTADEGLCKELIDPVIGDIEYLWRDHSTSLLIDSLLPYIKHQLLHVLRCNADEHSEHEVPLYLLRVL